MSVPLERGVREASGPVRPVCHDPRARAMIRSVTTLLLIAIMAADADAQDIHAASRKAMLDDIVALTRETRLETGRAALSARVLAAMNKVPRHRFVPLDLAGTAYSNRPLPIGL